MSVTTITRKGSKWVEKRDNDSGRRWMTRTFLWGLFRVDKEAGHTRFVLLPHFRRG